MKLDKYSRQLYSETDAINAIYTNPTVDLNKLDIESVSQFNSASQLLYTGIQLQELKTLNCSVEEYHKQNQKQWNMPTDYANFDIAKWCLDQCNNDVELQRVGKELIMFQERNLLNLLCFLRYFVATMRENNILWGVGRGSSVASYVLYLIGVHKIDSLYYDLNVEDFLR